MKTFCYCFVLITLSSFISNCLSSQTTIRGRVVSEESKEGLPWVNVTLLKASDSLFVKGTTTDEKGQFTLLQAEEGSYLIRFSFIGFESRYIQVHAAGTETETGTTELKPAASMLEGVEVAAKKPMYQYENEKKVYNVTEDPAVQNGVATDALQNAPGVYVDMEGNITLRGVSEVSIWINDKPSRITGDGLKSFLQQLPANSLERIEVITNPSAKYSAEGTGGIINIVLKEKIKRNFLLSGGISGSTQPSFNPWASFTWAEGKWSLNAYATHNASRWSSVSQSKNTAFQNNDTLYYTSNYSNYSSDHSWTYGSFYGSFEADSNNIIEFWAGGGTSTFSGKNFGEMNKTTLSPYEQFIRTDIWTTDNKDNPNSNYNAGLSYEHLFGKEGHKINANVYISGWGNGKNTSLSERQYNNMPWRNRKTLVKEMYGGTWNSAEVLYENPINKNRMFESGIEYTSSPYKNESVRDTFDYANQTWLYVPLFHDKFDQYKHYLNSYASYSDTLYRFTYKLGLRSEYRYLKLDSWSTQKIVSREDWNLFPTVHLSWSSKSRINVTLSYARRVSYPEYQINPFVHYSDEENISSGNPGLIPAFTNSFETGIAKFFNSGSSINLTLYHRRTMNEINRYKTVVFDSLLNRNTMYSTFLNSGSNIFTGSEMTFNYVVNRTYRIMLNFDAYRYDINADLGGYLVDRSDISYNGKIIVMASYGIIRLNATTIYRSASINMTGEQKPVYYINLSASADFFKRTLSVRAGVQDIFDWQKDEGTTVTPNLISDYSSKRLTRYLTFGVTYRFGKTELESKAKNVQAPVQ
jgi:hypothetical protein